MIVKNSLTEAGWFIIGTGVVWLAYEMYLIISKKEPISNQMTKLSVRLPFIAFAIGILCGHWFWPTIIEVVKDCTN